MGNEALPGLAGGTFMPGAMPAPDSLQTQNAPNNTPLAGGEETQSAPDNGQLEEPDPAQDVSRSVMAALSGGSGHPMDWAKAMIAGTLAGAANVGKAPPGGGFLYGLSRGAAGAQELQRQQDLDKQRLQQQQFENQEKLKADVHAEKELEIHTQDSAAQRAMWNAQTLASTQTRQQNAARFDDLQKEDKLRVRQLEDSIRESEQDQLSVLQAAGVDVTQLDHITGYDQITDSHAQQAGAGGIFAVPNGEEHKAGEDNAGAYMVPGGVWDRKIDKPITITSGYTLDKNGNAVPKQITAAAGTSVGTLLAVAKGAQKDLQTKQDQIYKAAQLQHEEAGTRAENERTATEAEQLHQLKEFDKGNLSDPFGNKIGALGMDKKEFVKRVDTYNKDYGKDLTGLDKAYNQLSDIISNAEKTKKLPGADAVVGVFDAIGISADPLKGRGLRIGEKVINEHVEGTRNAWENMALKFRRATPNGTGQIVTLQQLKDYQRIMDEARRDAYLGAGNAAIGQGIGVQTLPRGNNKPIDPNTMDIFIDLAGGDAAKASSVMKEFGWQPPAAH